MYNNKGQIRLQNKQNYQKKRKILYDEKRVVLQKRHYNPKYICTKQKKNNRTVEIGKSTIILRFQLLSQKLKE